MTHIIQKNFWLAFALFLGLATSQMSYAGINLVGGVSNGFNSSITGHSFSLLLGVEATLNIVNVVEAGVFYDHNLVDSSYFNFAGAVVRVGFGPASGLFVDAKLGVSPTYGWPGFGAGVGYHFNSIIGVHGGLRVLNEPAGVQTLGDLALMFFL